MTLVGFAENRIYVQRYKKKDPRIMSLGGDLHTGVNAVERLTACFYGMGKGLGVIYCTSCLAYRRALL